MKCMIRREVEGEVTATSEVKIKSTRSDTDFAML